MGASALPHGYGARRFGNLSIGNVHTQRSCQVEYAACLNATHRESGNASTRELIDADLTVAFSLVEMAEGECAVMRQWADGCTVAAEGARRTLDDIRGRLLRMPASTKRKRSGKPRVRGTRREAIEPRQCSTTGLTNDDRINENVAKILYSVPMTPEQARFLLDFTLPTLKQETATTAKILGATPNANLDYRPSERCMPADQLLWHIASSDVTRVPRRNPERRIRQER